jgi:outer membrane protein assembly factor BamB
MSDLASPAPQSGGKGRKKKQRKFWPPIWMRILVVVILGAMLWIRVNNSAGDQGMTNVNSTMTGFLAVLILAPWFIFFSAYSRKVRFGVPLVLIMGLVAFVNLFRFEGFSGNMVPRFTLSTGSDLGASPTSAGQAVDLQTTTPGDYPGYLGPQRNVHLTHVELQTDWESRAPEEVWRQPIGQGHSAFAVVNGIAVTMEQRGDEEAITAYDAGSGELLWINSAPGRYSHPLGGVGPRSTPTISDGRVYAVGAAGRFVCLQGATGEVIWERNLLDDYDVSSDQEVQNIEFGRSNSPLVVNDLVFLPAGGNKGGKIASLAAFDKLTGETIWESGDRQISFASPNLATVAGVSQVLNVNEDTLGGYDPETGRQLWEFPWPGNTPSNSSSSQAVAVAPDQVFISKGYGGGAALLQLSPQDDGTMAVNEIWADQRVMRTKFTQVVMLDGYVYGLSDGILECIALDTGKRVWKAGRYGHGQILAVRDKLLVLTEEGEVVLVAMTPEEPNKVLGRFQAVNGPTWNNMALSGDLLLVRNSREAAAWRLPLDGPLALLRTD